MSGNSGAWGIAMWRDERGFLGAFDGISLEGGDAVIPYLPTDPLGCLTAPPDGLGVPPVRNGDVVFAQRDGVVQFADYYEPRLLTFQVTICNDGCPGCPTGRAKVKRLTSEWSRNCNGATLVIFPDCYDPDATEEEKTYLGPYLVHGRPRVADIQWLRSDVGCANITLRFDAEDARLLLAQTPEDSGWTADHQVIIEPNENLIPDAYRLEGLTMSVNGATVDDSFPETGAPDGGSYFSRFVSAVPTSSPHSMELMGSGVSGLPVDPGDTLSFAWWARKMNPSGGIPQTRVDWSWYNAGGGLISNHGSAGMVATSDWQRFTEENIVAPALAEFVQFRLIWTGIPGTPGYTLDFAQAWLNEGVTVTGPTEVEVVGDFCAYAVYTLSGPLTGPIEVFFSGPGGDSSFIYSEDIDPGDTVVIDTQYGVATSGGIEVTQFLSGDYNSPLSPGINEVWFTSSDPTDTGDLIVSWENAVVSG
jgi:hypothetical protein